MIPILKQVVCSVNVLSLNGVVVATLLRHLPDTSKSKQTMLHAKFQNHRPSGSGEEDF